MLKDFINRLFNSSPEQVPSLTLVDSAPALPGNKKVKTTHTFELYYGFSEVISGKEGNEVTIPLYSDSGRTYHVGDFLGTVYNNNGSMRVKGYCCGAFGCLAFLRALEQDTSGVLYLRKGTPLATLEINYTESL